MNCTQEGPLPVVVTVGCLVNLPVAELRLYTCRSWDFCPAAMTQLLSGDRLNDLGVSPVLNWPIEVSLPSVELTLKPATEL